MASIFQVFDFNQVLSGKKQAPDRRHIDGGLEAPRNSLDIPKEAFETPRCSFVKPEDVPFGYEIYRSHCIRRASEGPSRAIMTQDLSGVSDSKRRAPSVVARLMGLDALPDELPTVPPGTRKASREYPPHPDIRQAGTPYLVRQSSAGSIRSSSGWAQAQSRNAPRNESDCEEKKPQFEVLPFRDHPQEKQLQEFKREFAAQLAGLPQEHDHPHPVQVRDMSRQLGAKEMQVHAALYEAKHLLAQDRSHDLKYQSASEKLQESKELLDAVEFLQSNKEYFFRFVHQKPQSLFGRQSQESKSREGSKPPSPSKPTKKATAEQSSSETSERKREGFSPRAFARQFLESRRRHEPKKQPEKTMQSDNCSLGSQPELSRCTSSKNRTPEGERPNNVSLLKPSFVKSNAAKPPMAPKVSSKLPRNARDSRETNREGAGELVREVKERARQQEYERPRDETRSSKAISRDSLRNSCQDPKEIAREIARHAREAAAAVQAKDASRLGPVTLTRSRSTGKRVSAQRVMGDLDATCNSDGEGTSTPSVRLARDQVSRSCTSLPSSPHLTQGQEAAATKVISKKQTPEKLRAPYADHAVELMSNRVEGRVGNKVVVAPEANGFGGLPHSSAVQSSKSPLITSNAPDASSANETNPSVKMKKGPDHSRSPRKREEDKESPHRPMLSRCRSVPNAAFSHERGSAEVSIKTATTGPGQYHKATGAKAGAKAKSKTPKAAGAGIPKTRGQTIERGRGFFSVTRKKTEASLKEASTPHTSLPCSSPVLACAAAQEEADAPQPSASSGVNCVGDRGTHAENCTLPHKPGSVGDLALVVISNPEDCLPALGASNEVRNGPNPSAQLCEEFLEALSQLTPQALLRDDAGEATRDQHNATVSVLQSEVEQKGRIPRQWTITQDNSDEGGDFSIDKGGQPSPISVLESPFEEGSPSPLEFKEITNDLQELRIRLRLLKMDGSERPRTDLENVPESDLVLADAVSARDPPRDSLPRTAATQESCAGSTYQHKLLADRLLSKAHLNQSAFERIGIRGIPCAKGKEDDLLYVRNVLAASGLVDDNSSVLTRWHSPSCPLGPRIFDELESSYAAQRFQSCVGGGSGKILVSRVERRSKRETSNRRLLFNAVNEVLLRKLGPHFDHNPLVNSRAPKLFAIASGKKLVEETWRDICEQGLCLWEDAPDDYLEGLIALDMSKDGSWAAFHEDVDRIGLQLEQAIFNDLVEETIVGLLGNQNKAGSLIS